MKETCLSLYERMLHELHLCKKPSRSSASEIECCFQIAYGAWEAVSKKLRGYFFPNDWEEIEFFKVLRPKFTSEIEYYSLLYHAILFEPGEHLSKLMFWQREHKRLAEFELQNQSFLYCYHADDCKTTPFYFLRRYCRSDNATRVLNYGGSSALTNGDWLVARYVALLRFHPYAIDKLALVRD
jgi:hypothetical protein